MTDNFSICFTPQFDIYPKECECKRVKFGLAELTKIMKSSTFSETPFYFSVTVGDTVYMLASATERDRSRWLIFIKNLAVCIYNLASSHSSHCLLVLILIDWLHPVLFVVHSVQKSAR